MAFFGVPLAIHGILGAIIGIIALLLIWLAQFANTSRSQRILAFALVGLIALQPWTVRIPRRALELNQEWQAPMGSAQQPLEVIGQSIAVASRSEETGK